MRTVVDFALSYLAAGLVPIPIRADGSKAPDLPAWRRYQIAPPTEQEVRDWFSGGRVRGIGLVWGAASGNGEALDFDEPGLCEQFEALCAEQLDGFGELVLSCPLVATPSGGRHLLYRSDAPVGGNTKLAQIECGGSIETLIETRGEGGYTLAPGSPAECHPQNAPYCFIRGDEWSIPTITAEQRSVLLALAATFDRYVRPGSVRDMPSQRRAASGVKRPGDDYNERSDYESLLAERGWRMLRETRGGVRLWQRPGKHGIGISATSNYAGRGLFHVFSTNASPFEAGVSYSPFAVYTLLEHGGDYESAARALGVLGYGEEIGSAYDEAATTANSSPGLPARAPEWPVCAPEAFHGLAGEIIRAIEPHTEADPLALLIQLLIAFGSAVGPPAHFTAEADKHHGNLFAVLVGVSSKGRKGTSWGYVRELFRRAYTHWSESCIKSGLSSGEGLIHHVRDPIEKEKVDKNTGEVDTVVEDAGVSDKRLLVIEPEFATVLRQTQRDGNTLSATVRNAWDTGTLQNLTKTSPAKATGAHISIIGHITKDELKRELSATETGNGFGNRFLWLCVRRSKELPEGGKFDTDAQDELVERLSAAIQRARQAEKLARDPVAREVWCAVYGRLSAGKPGLFGALTGRSEAQVMRLALLYALLDQAAAIRAEHLTAALALWEYCEESVRYVFGDSLGDRVADEILRMLRAAPDGLSRSEINNAFNRNRNTAQIGAALHLLVEIGAARCEMRSTGGRPTEYWRATK